MISIIIWTLVIMTSVLCIAVIYVTIGIYKEKFILKSIKPFESLAVKVCETSQNKKWVDLNGNEIEEKSIIDNRKTIGKPGSILVKNPFLYIMDSLFYPDSFDLALPVQVNTYWQETLQIKETKI